MAAGFEHPKVKIHIGDGFAFLEDKVDSFDVIITDSSDPVGPAASLFQAKFFELMKNALHAGGIICTQCECIWLHMPIIKEVTGFCRKLFAKVDYGFVTIPTYPCGQIGLMVCSKDGGLNVPEPLRKWTKEQEAKFCRYYNSEIHRASFVLPQFAKAALEAPEESK
ncbi:putrescine aminopropyltransferase [Lunasporangiospora selenospora]|uniref:Putrescine aminopropyltransferase n=1 Tax=Lunasporangiospora selenospora TaxID=979761 RepID=A0A9P6KF26_9FUNG|nr:putrescine aminopropyltransferase [Lunasporangiospora selenospora]